MPENYSHNNNFKPLRKKPIKNNIKLENFNSYANLAPKRIEKPKKNPRVLKNIEHLAPIELAPNDFEPNYVNLLDFPENTSIEIKPFTAENVTSLFEGDTITNLYNNINRDIFRKFKNSTYML